mmetsp:Transcript_33584/g.74363  ORF Transcript_33584/g.74363 Transcript_33584/m.74363 type:complete len:237 (-) Transcript_33584:525-1235(-)
MVHCTSCSVPQGTYMHTHCGTHAYPSHIHCWGTGAGNADAQIACGPWMQGSCVKMCGHMSLHACRMFLQISTTRWSGMLSRVACRPSMSLAFIRAERTASCILLHTAALSLDSSFSQASSTLTRTWSFRLAMISSCSLSLECWSRIIFCCAVTSTCCSTSCAPWVAIVVLCAPTCSCSSWICAAWEATCWLSPALATSSSEARTSMALSAASCAVSISTALCSSWCSAFLRSLYFC